MAMTARPGALSLDEDDRRVLARWAADCAARVLPLFERRCPADPRPWEAIDGVRAFVLGKGRIGELRTLAARARAAGWEAGDPTATAAARAAGHAAAVAHLGSQARGASAYAALAVSRAAPDAPEAAADELRWAVRHASPAVRAAYRRLPPPPASAGPITALVHDLDTALLLAR
jgi:hypothetical protein